jgi:hypothetical protein
MTIFEAINRIDMLKPNKYTQPEKVRWLSTLDGIVKKQIIDTHEGAEDIAFSGYTEETPLTTELLVPAPYDDVYLRWLETWIDFYNGEYGRYNNSAQAYNDAFSAYEKHYNRTHMPLGKKLTFF